MFVSHSEGFDLFMALVASGISFCDVFLCGTGIREIKNQREKTDDRNEKHFFAHTKPSFSDGEMNPLLGSEYYIIATVG
jgi:hypothetical protein